MKTRFKTSSKTQKKSILENSNFLNSQNYIKDSRSKLYLNYHKNYNFIEFLLYIFLPLLFMWLYAFVVMLIIEDMQIGVVSFLIIQLIGFLIPLLLVTKLLRYKKYKRNTKEIIILYLKPYSLINLLNFTSNWKDIKYYKKCFHIMKKHK